MSASREKKQRLGSTPADKHMSAQKEAAAAHRKTIQYTVIGVIVAILVVALLVWNSGIFQRRATAVTIGNTDYSVAEVNYYYYNIYQTTALYAQYGMSSYDTSLSPEEQTYSTDEETGEVTTYHDYFLNTAIEELTDVTALYDAAIASGYTTDDVKEDVDASIKSTRESASSNGYSTFKQFLVSYYGKYMTPSVYEDILYRTTLASQFQQDHADALVYTDEDYQTYYKENANTLDTFEHSYLYFKAEDVATTDADGNTIEMTDDEKAAAQAENMEAAKAKAEEVMAAIQSGKSVSDLIEAYAPTSSGVDSATLGSALSSVYSEWLTDSSRKAGDVNVVEYTDNGYYVVVFQNRYLDETPTVDTRHILIKAELVDDATEPTEEAMAAAKAKAEEILSQWQTGEATEDSFAALANEYSEDTGSNTNGGLYEAVNKGKFVTSYDEWLFDAARAAGDTAVLENNGDGSYYGYHVVYYIGENEPVWKNTVRSTLSEEDTTAWLESLVSGYSATQADGIKHIG